MPYTCDTENLDAALAAAAIPDFAALFQSLPSPYMVLDRRLNFVDANEAYCRVTERAREELIGRNVFALFPNAGPSGRRLRESFERVLETGRPHSLPLLSYPIPLPRSRAGELAMRYWSAVHTPLLGPDGRTRFVVQHAVSERQLELVWREHDGPQVRRPSRRGFGSRLIERSLGADGRSVLDFAPDGLVCRLAMGLGFE
jgi:PAS domain-containing protein